jgi:UDP-N-acetylglucosamine acyltransferase
MNKIHKTAYISKQVIIGENNIIGQNVIIDGNVEIGDNNIIGPNSVLIKNLKIGSNNHFHGSISIGSVGEMGTKGDTFLDNGLVEIGSNNTFREFITINSPVRRESTKVGNNGYFMARCHIPHDAAIGDFVTMATNSIIGGGCIVNDYAYLGLGSITHQWLEIGKYAMVGMQSVNTKDVPPYCIVVGIPSMISGINKIGLLRRGFNEELISEADLELRTLWKQTNKIQNTILAEIMEFSQRNLNCIKKFSI